MNRDSREFSSISDNEPEESFLDVDSESDENNSGFSSEISEETGQKNRTKISRDIERLYDDLRDFRDKILSDVTSNEKKKRFFSLLINEIKIIEIDNALNEMDNHGGWRGLEVYCIKKKFQDRREELEEMKAKCEVKRNEKLKSEIEKHKKKVDKEDAHLDLDEKYKKNKREWAKKKIMYAKKIAKFKKIDWVKKVRFGYGFGFSFSEIEALYDEVEKDKEEYFFFTHFLSIVRHDEEEKKYYIEEKSQVMKMIRDFTKVGHCFIDVEWRKLLNYDQYREEIEKYARFNPDLNLQRQRNEENEEEKDVQVYDTNVCYYYDKFFDKQRNRYSFMTKWVSHVRELIEDSIQWPIVPQELVINLGFLILWIIGLPIFLLAEILEIFSCGYFYIFFNFFLKNDFYLTSRKFLAHFNVDYNRKKLFNLKKKRCLKAPIFFLPIKMIAENIHEYIPYMSHIEDIEYAIMFSNPVYLKHLLECTEYINFIEDEEDLRNLDNLNAIRILPIEEPLCSTNQFVINPHFPFLYRVFAFIISIIQAFAYIVLALSVEYQEKEGPGNLGITRYKISIYTAKFAVSLVTGYFFINGFNIKMDFILKNKQNFFERFYIDFIDPIVGFFLIPFVLTYNAVMKEEKEIDVILCLFQFLNLLMCLALVYSTILITRTQDTALEMVYNFTTLIVISKLDTKFSSFFSHKIITSYVSLDSYINKTDRSELSFNSVLEFSDDYEEKKRRRENGHLHHHHQEFKLESHVKDLVVSLLSSYEKRIEDLENKLLSKKHHSSEGKEAKEGEEMKETVEIEEPEERKADKKKIDQVIENSIILTDNEKSTPNLLTREEKKRLRYKYKTMENKFIPTNMELNNFVNDLRFDDEKKKVFYLKFLQDYGEKMKNRHEKKMLKYDKIKYDKYYIQRQNFLKFIYLIIIFIATFVLMTIKLKQEDLNKAFFDQF